ncbi:hypothetical protein PM082_008765 [Marasmius tenuissimus]|nr:hypothetical protein PM082_008765 [Marasmius tenuissimus]
MYNQNLHKAEKCSLFTLPNAIGPPSTIVPSFATVHPEKAKTTAARLTQLMICPKGNKGGCVLGNSSDSQAKTHLGDIHIMCFPEDVFLLAKEFWQAIAREEWHFELFGGTLSIWLFFWTFPCLSLLLSTPRGCSIHEKFPIDTIRELTTHNHEWLTQCFPWWQGQGIRRRERYSYNVPITAATTAKQALHRTVLGILSWNGDAPSTSTQEITELPEDVDYYLTGMNAICRAHQLALSTLPKAKNNKECLFWVPIH